MDSAMGLEEYEMQKKYLYLGLVINLLITLSAVFASFKDLLHASGGNPLAFIFYLIIFSIMFFLPAMVLSMFLTAVWVSVEASFSLMMYSLSWVLKKTTLRRKSKTRPRRLVSCFLTKEEEDNIFGDLCEEYAQFKSKTEGCIWYCRQIIKSIPPLVYKNLKSRLVSHFGERIR
jgi:hypothetical protein